MDNRIKAVKIGDRAAEKIFKYPKGFKVHSIFRHAVNFIFEEDFLVTVLDEKDGTSSQVILVESEDLDRLLSLNIFTGEPVDISSLIYFKEAEVISSQIAVDKENPNIDLLIKKMKICEEYFIKYGKISEFAASVFGKDNIYKKYVLKGLNSLRDAYLNKNKQVMAASLSEFIGLGQGLTPSGDDFVCGFITVLFYYPSITGLDNNWTRDMGLKVIEYAVNKTTLTSYNMLRACLRGEIPEHMQSFMNCISTSEDENLLPCISKILKIGSTSGSDMFLGVLYGLYLIEKTEGLEPLLGGIK